ncbi:STAS domain-containing protein [Coralloluteibacterium stylophorae]|uniref:STAS domain-containing protein n=1 Tax=Coralloluteibacterium stylophorae TaxID=1776034 RepID=A0A8J8AXB4_9GAMM|nr:STAS domain-containing protein [Coralloluteibacterium stylophorae]MBS7457250.1 STAS domain-containing protein [Coralloluteibacterium stylophorae]
MTAVDLGADLGIEAAAELKARLSAHLASECGVVLAAENVERVHTASLQLLSAFVRDRRKAGLRTDFEACAPPLREAARLLGLDVHLGLDTVASSETTSIPEQSK